MEDITRVALELHQGPDCKVIPETLPKARLRDWTALGGAGPRYRCRNKDEAQAFVNIDKDTKCTVSAAEVGHDTIEKDILNLNVAFVDK